MTMINRKTITMTKIRCGDDKKKKRIMAIGRQAQENNDSKRK